MSKSKHRKSSFSYDHTKKVTAELLRRRHAPAVVQDSCVSAAAAVSTTPVRPLAQPTPGQAWYAGLPQFKKYNPNATADRPR